MLPIIATQAAPTASVPIAPIAAQAAIEGRVVTPDGAPVVHASVYLTRRWFERDVSEPVVTDDTGQFRLPAPGGVDGETLIVLPDAPGSPLSFTSLSTAAATGHAPITVVIRPGTTLQVPFIDAAGKPLAGHLVAIFPTADRPAKIDGTVIDRSFPRLPDALKTRMSGRTDAHGVLTLPGLTPGSRIGLTIQASDRFEPLVLRGGISLPAGPVTAVAPPIKIALNGSLAGRVFYRHTGKPVRNALVMPVGPGYHQFLPGVRTDAEGMYRIAGLFPASYQVMMQDTAALRNRSDGSNAYLPLSRTPQGLWLLPFSYHGIDVRAGQAVTGADFALVRPATVVVHLTDSAGRPVYGIPVSLTRADGAGTGSATGLDGPRTLQEAPGRVVVSWSRQAESPPAGTRTLTLAEGRTYHVTFSTGDDAAGRVRNTRRAAAPPFTVSDRHGQPIRLSDFHGKVLVLDLLLLPQAEGKDAMLAALRHTNQVVRTFPADRVTALAVDLTPASPEANAAFATWLDRHHPKLAAIRFARDNSDWHRTGQGDLANRYQATGFPLRFVIAPDGTLLRKFAEPDVLQDEKRLQQAIREALRSH